MTLRPFGPGRHSFALGLFSQPSSCFCGRICLQTEKSRAPPGCRRSPAARYWPRAFHRKVTASARVQLRLGEKNVSVMPGPAPRARRCGNRRRGARRRRDSLSRENCGLPRALQSMVMIWTRVPGQIRGEDGLRRTGHDAVLLRLSHGVRVIWKKSQNCVAVL